MSIKTLKELNDYCCFLKRHRKNWHIDTIKEYLCAVYINSDLFKVNKNLKINNDLFFK